MRHSLPLDQSSLLNLNFHMKFHRSGGGDGNPVSSARFSTFTGGLFQLRSAFILFLKKKNTSRVEEDDVRKTTGGRATSIYLLCPSVGRVYLCLLSMKCGPILEREQLCQSLYQQKCVSLTFFSRWQAGHKVGGRFFFHPIPLTRCGQQSAIRHKLTNDRKDIGSRPNMLGWWMFSRAGSTIHEVKEIPHHLLFSGGKKARAAAAAEWWVSALLASACPFHTAKLYDAGNDVGFLFSSSLSIHLFCEKPCPSGSVILLLLDRIH